MATFVSDNFLEGSLTILSSHTPQVGGSWVKYTVASNENVNVSGGNAGELESASYGQYYNTASPINANYYVEAVVHVAATGNSSYPGVSGRMDTGVNTQYRFYYDDLGAQWVLDKYVNNGNTQLGTYSQALSAGNSYTLRLTMNGTSIVGSVNGTDIISVVDSSIVAAGQPGVFQGGQTLQQLHGTYIAVDIVVGPNTPFFTTIDAKRM